MQHAEKTRKLNIALVADPVGKSGTEFLTGLIKILAELSGNLHVTTGNFPIERFLSQKIHIENIENDLEKQAKGSRLAIISKFVSKEIKLSIAVIKVSRKADVVVFVGLSPVLPILAARILRKDTLRVAAASLEQHARLAFGTRSLFYYLPVILERLSYALSSRIAEYGELGLDRHGDKVLRVSRPLSIDTTLFKPSRGLEQRKDVVGYIGRMEKIKGVLNFVKAMPLILKERPDVEFLIGGDGALSGQVKDTLQRNSLSDKTKFCGWIAHDELPDYFSELKLIVFPSYSEADLPAVAWEAMACGTPILIVPVSGISKVVKEGENGFIMADNSPQSIAQNTIRVLNHPDLARVGNNARVFVDKEYGLEAVVECYREILYRERR